jgi:hypothetical protein
MGDAHAFIHIYIYIYIYIFTYIQTYIYIYTYIYMQRERDVQWIEVARVGAGGAGAPVPRKEDTRLPGKRHSNSHGLGPVY